MMVTTFEKGIAKGRQEERQQVARLLLERKFGPLSETSLTRLATWPMERLQELILTVQDASSLDALGLVEENDKVKINRQGDRTDDAHDV
jgi:hypothetical protein